MLRFAAAISLIALLFGFAVPAYADNRVALVIGNGAYQNTPRLPNPSNDAADVAASLKRSGFETILATDLDKAAMDAAMIRFARASRTADVAIFYYSGHAMQFGGVNYLAPIDAKLTDEADLRRMVRVDEIVSDLQQAKNLRILVLDSCRDNPLADELKRSIGTTRALPLQRGLAKIDSPQGMIVAYATQSGRTAEDGDGRNSPYTAAFVKNIEAQAEIGTIFRRISADVYETTKHTQLPELSLSLIGEFYLRGKIDIVIKPQNPSSEPPQDQHFRTTFNEDLEKAGAVNYISIREKAITRTAPTNSAASMFTLGDGEEVTALGQFKAEDSNDQVFSFEDEYRIWIKIATRQGNEGFVLLHDVLTPDQFERRKDLINQRKAMEALFERAKKSNGTFAKIAGIYCPNQCVDVTGLNLGIAMFRWLAWGEGDTFYWVMIGRPVATPPVSIKKADIISFNGREEPYGSAGKVQTYLVTWKSGTDKIGFSDHNAFYRSGTTPGTDYKNMTRFDLKSQEYTILHQLWPMAIERWPRIPERKEATK